MLSLYGENLALCQHLSEQYGFDLLIERPVSGYFMHQFDDVLALESAEAKKAKPLFVDFLSGKALHRLQFGGGKGQAIAKAVGCKGGELPRVLDATAGLGGDAFVLASLGCKLTLLEQSPAAAALLENGLARAAGNSMTSNIVDRMTLHHVNAIHYLQKMNTDFPDVIYLDPMFPERKKSAAVKKGMRFFHDVIGVASSEDESALLAIAKKKASKRVVVKRPKHAGYLAGKKPSAQIIGKTTRYDLYVVS